MTQHKYVSMTRVQAISDKANDLTQWLAQNAPDCEASQKHLDAGTVEQAYWHYGYLCAMRDVLAMINSTSSGE